MPPLVLKSMEMQISTLGDSDESALARALKWATSAVWEPPGRGLGGWPFREGFLEEVMPVLGFVARKGIHGVARQEKGTPGTGNSIGKSLVRLGK